MFNTYYTPYRASQNDLLGSVLTLYELHSGEEYQDSGIHNYIEHLLYYLMCVCGIYTMYHVYTQL